MSGLATHRPSRSMRMRTSAGAASENVIVRRSLRPSPLGENTAGANRYEPEGAIHAQRDQLLNRDAGRGSRSDDDVVLAVGERGSVDRHGVLSRTHPDAVDNRRDHTFNRVRNLHGHVRRSQRCGM